jgi:hypothetical protein
LLDIKIPASYSNFNYRKVIMFAFLAVIFLLISFSASALAQSSYPTIDKVAQQARDEDRRLILSTELQAEHQELAKAQAALAAGATEERQAEVHRRSENVKALQRELEGVAGSCNRPPASLATRSANSTATFWNPYNRAPDPEASTDSSTALRREIP